MQGAAQSVESQGTWIGSCCSALLPCPGSACGLASLVHLSCLLSKWCSSGSLSRGACKVGHGADNKERLQVCGEQEEQGLLLEGGLAVKISQ